MTAASEFKSVADQAQPQADVTQEASPAEAASGCPVAGVARQEDPAGFVASESPAQAAVAAASAPPPTQAQNSGFWTGVMTGVLATLALVAFPVYEGVLKHRQHSSVLAQAQHQNLELRVTMAQKDLGTIEQKLAEIEALEAEFRAMQVQKQQLQQQRDGLSQRLKGLQQQMVSP